MLMHVWFARRIPSALRMSMMFIMRVSMRMNYWFVIVEMLVTLRDVEPHPETHQCTGNNEWHRNWLDKCKNRHDRAKKGKAFHPSWRVGLAAALLAGLSRPWGRASVENWAISSYL